MPHPKPADLEMNKHSDYFVWKDTSERVARRCFYTVDKKRVNSCVLKHLFLEGVEQPKTSPKNLGNAHSDALLMSRFAADAAKIKNKKRAVLIYELIRNNSGPNILRSCFLHWPNPDAKIWLDTHKLLDPEACLSWGRVCQSIDFK